MDYPKSDSSIGLVNGKFVDENLVTGQPGSIIPADWANALMSEFFAVYAHAGIEPDEQALDQLKTAIWKRATESFAGVSRFATELEALAGEADNIIISPATLWAAIGSFGQEVITAKSFAEIVTLTSDQGPIVVHDMDGRAWTWVETPYFTGYRSSMCGEIIPGNTVSPRSYQILATGGVWDQANEKDRRVISHFREQGLVVHIDDWIPRQGMIADLGNGLWKAPDMQNVFLRMSGTDADTANARALGSHQMDDFKSHSHDYQYVGSGSTNATILGGATYPRPTTATSLTGGAETRSINSAVTPFIHV